MNEEFKKLLEEEKAKLENIISSIGRKDSSVPGEEGWEAAYPELNTMPADKNEMADEVTAFDNALGVEAKLEERLIRVRDALEKIEKGNYGKCEKCRKKIDIERLKANPAAQNCMAKH
ncbi:TraR/DksA family transcriptional regulator [Patescibacteria group bacterium]